MTPAKQNLAILLWNARPEAIPPQLCATPFVHAACAAAMDCQVEIHFTGSAVRWLVAGVAAEVHLNSPDSTLYQLMQQAANLGVQFFACAMARTAFIGHDDRLITEYSGTAGATTFIQRALDPTWATLIY